MAETPAILSFHGFPQFHHVPNSDRLVCSRFLSVPTYFRYRQMRTRRPIPDVLHLDTPTIRCDTADRSSHPITGLGRPLGLQEVEVSIITRKSAHECGKVVSHRHRPPLPPRDISLLLIFVRARVEPRAISAFDIHR